MGSTPRLRLGVLASLLVNIALELHSVVHRRLLSIVDSVGGQVQLGCASLYLPPPHQQCSEVVLGVLHRLQCNVDSEEGQVHLGFASLNLDLALVDLRGVGGGLPRATSSSGSSGQVQVQLGFASLDLDLT